MKKSLTLLGFLGEGSVTFLKHFVTNQLTKQNNHESLFKDFFQNEKGYSLFMHWQLKASLWGFELCSFLPLKENSKPYMTKGILQMRYVFVHFVLFFDREREVTVTSKVSKKNLLRFA